MSTSLYFEVLIIRNKTCSPKHFELRDSTVQSWTKVILKRQEFHRLQRKFVFIKKVFELDSILVFYVPFDNILLLFYQKSLHVIDREL